VSVADLASGVARLARELRRAGVPVLLGDELDAAAALALLGRADRDEARRALLVALKIRRGDRDRFDAVLDELWEERPPIPLAPSVVPPRESASRAPPSPGHPERSATGRSREVEGRSGRAGGVSDEPGGGEAPEGEPGYSPEASLRHKPFEECTAAELGAMEHVLQRFAARVAARKSRRLVPARGRGSPDLRRSLRRVVASDGELVLLARRARAAERPRLVLLCDTSGSMAAHARFLLAFALSLRRVARSTEVFAFSTSLVRLTPWLARPERVGDTLARLQAELPDWSGGTRIGESLEEFVTEHLRRRVDARTVVVILSDGLDRGDTSRLAAAMQAIRAAARRVIWLNPLLGDARYEPIARGMAAALPHVDDFLPAHDLASLEALLPRLSAPPRRPA
jgi:uncharacterized protein with von Willebrand factor type A (vWA) domain